MDTRAPFILSLLWLLFRIPLQTILGDVPFGCWSFACDNILLFALITTGGFSQAVSRLVTNARARRDFAGEVGVIRYALISALVFGAVSSLLLYLLAPQICFLLFGSSMTDVMIPLRVMAPSVFCMSVSGVMRGYFIGVGTFRPARVSQFLFVIVSMLTSLIAALLIHQEKIPFRASAISFGILFGSFASMLILLALYLMYRPGIILRARKDTLHAAPSFSTFLKGFFARFKPFIFSTIGLMVLILADAALFSHFTGLKAYDAGLISSFYGIYSGKLLLFLLLPLLILISAMPEMTNRLSTEYIHGDSSQLILSARGVLHYAMTIAIPLCVTGAAAGDAVTGLLFQDYSLMTRQIVLTGIPMALFASYAAASSFVLIGIDKMKSLLINCISAFVIHAVFLIILLQFSDMNIYALTYSDTIFTFAAAALNTITMIRKMSFSHSYTKTFLLPAAASAVMGILVFLIYHGLISVELPAGLAALAAIIVSIISYTFVLIRIKGITQEEMRQYPLGKAFAFAAVKLHFF